MDNSCPSTVMLGSLIVPSWRWWPATITQPCKTRRHGSYIIVVGMYIVLELAWGRHVLVIVSTTKFIVRSLYISYIVAKIAGPTSCYSLISLIYWSLCINLYLIVVINYWFQLSVLLPVLSASFFSFFFSLSKLLHFFQVKFFFSLSRGRICCFGDYILDGYTYNNNLWSLIITTLPLIKSSEESNSSCVNAILISYMHLVCDSS